MGRSVPARQTGDDSTPHDAAAAAKATAPSAGRGGYRRGGRYRPTDLDLTTGSIPKSLFRLAWPQSTEGVLSVADQLVDLVWAGRLPGGFRSIAGLGVAQTFVQFSFMARQGLDQSVRAMVSRAVGAGEIPLANHITLQACTLTAIFTLLVVLIGGLGTDVLLRAVGASDALQGEAAMYMRVVFFGVGALAFRMIAASALQGSGNVMTPLMSTTVTRVLHVVITPFLMFGWWGFPHMGLAGAALANVLAQAVGTAINFYALFTGSSRLKLTLRGYRVDYPMLWQMVKIGAPASTAGALQSLSQMVLLRLVTPFGDVAVAAYALTRRIEMLAHFGSAGFGNAAGIMVGQNLGAGHPERARQAVGWALVYIMAIKVTVGGIIALFAVGLIGIFTHEAEVVEVTTLWVRIQLITAVIIGFQIVFQQAYNTAGDTLAPMIVSSLGIWGIEVPLAWFLTQTTEVGAIGVAFAGVVAVSARAVAYVPYFYWGRWLRVKVI